MWSLLRIWSGLAALAFVTGETLTASPDKPLAVLLPYYVIAVWLLAGLFLARVGPALLLSGWGTAFGYSYVAFADLFTVFEPPGFFLVLVGITAVGSLAGLLLASFCIRALPEETPARAKRPFETLRLSRGWTLAFVALVVLAQSFTPWGEDKRLILLVPYYLIAAWLAVAVLRRNSGLKLLFLGWSVALGFFYAEYSGFLVFFQRPTWVLALSGAVTGMSAIGALLALGSLNLRPVEQSPRRPSANSVAGL